MIIKISYFYQLRFFKPYQIPVSTALIDPKWYRGKPHKDKNGVYNGIRCEMLHADIDFDGASCGKNCKDDPTTCTFMTAYRSQLEQTDFNSVLDWLGQVANNVKRIEGFEEEPEIILMVYETPDNPCSERQPLIDWFKKHGVNLEEYKKE